jgi:membrane protease YdiL (CAAX protease family)
MQISGIRQGACLVLGLVAWFAVAIIADFVLVTQLDLAAGWRFALLGGAQLVLGGSAVVLALHFAGIPRAQVGFSTHRLRSDLMVGLAVAAVFAALQFLVIIPSTGGASRSDIVANAAQIGETIPNLAGVLVLALLGSTSEEFLFRGLLLGGIAWAAGGGTLARASATVLTVLLFAFSHGYQGWAGMVDTGLYGGLLLSVLYWWRGARLAAPVAAHVGWNVAAALVIFTAY